MPLCLVVGIGVIGMRQVKSFSDFLLGGRAVGPVMTAFTYGTAYFSAVIFVGFAGKVGWVYGCSGLWVAFLNAFGGVFLVWALVGPRARQASLSYQVSTMPEFLEIRYQSKFIKIFASMAIFIFFIPYSAAVFMGLSYLFRSTFGIDYITALIFMGAFTAIYLMLGGYKSMALIDVVFGMIMIIGVSVLLFFTLNKGGGFERIVFNLSRIDPRLVGFVGPPGAWSLFCLVFLTTAAPFAMPQLIQKFFAIKDDKAIQVGKYFCTFFAFLIAVVAYFAGTTTRLFLSPLNSPSAFHKGEPLFDALMPELLTQIIPDSLSIVMLLLILAASMSTLAALVLISSSCLAKDVYAGFINPKADDKTLTFLMRLFSVFFVILSVCLAYLRPVGIVAILGVSWGAIGACFLGPFIWGLYWKKTNKFAAISSMLGGLGICLGFYIAGYPSTEAGTLGMLASLLIAPLVSIFFGSSLMRNF